MDVNGGTMVLKSCENIFNHTFIFIYEQNLSNFTYIFLLEVNFENLIIELHARIISSILAKIQDY